MKILLSVFIAFNLLGSFDSAWAGQSSAKMWNSAHWAAKVNRLAASNTIYKRLLKKKNTGYNVHEIYLNMARNFFKMGKFKTALKYYNKVPKTSDFWILAVEERAWSNVRLGRFNEALADAATLRSPVFKHISPAETYYLSSYIYLAICNYKDLFKNTELFKKNHGLKIIALEKLKNKKAKSWIIPFLTDVSQKGLEASLTKETLSIMPNYFYKYKRLQRLLQKIEKRKVVRNSDINKTQNLLARYAGLALKEYRVVIKKMQLIEADAIQRIHVDKSLLGKRDWMSKKQDVADANLLNFPFDEEDVWLDELDNYDVKSKSCPKIMEARR